MKSKLKVESLSARASLIGAFVNFVVLVVFTIYGAIYDYFDIAVFLFLIAGVCFSLLYSFTHGKISEFCNLLAVLFISLGVSLFALNSFPVWADRLNHITMYGSRGTLVPVIAIIILCMVVAVVDIISCFTGKGDSVQ